MSSDINTVCNKEISRLSRNVRLILNKDTITNDELEDLNRYYNDLDYYNYYKNYRKLKMALTEDYLNEQE